jgi:hypothetical protein
LRTATATCCEFRNSLARAAIFPRLNCDGVARNTFHPSNPLQASQETHPSVLAVNVVVNVNDKNKTIVNFNVSTNSGIRA